MRTTAQGASPGWPLLETSTMNKVKRGDACFSPSPQRLSCYKRTTWKGKRQASTLVRRVFVLQQYVGHVNVFFAHGILFPVYGVHEKHQTSVFTLTGCFPPKQNWLVWTFMLMHWPTISAVQGPFKLGGNPYMYNISVLRLSLFSSHFRDNACHSGEGVVA